MTILLLEVKLEESEGRLVAEGAVEASAVVEGFEVVEDDPVSLSVGIEAA
jgi:hypothetical protein